MWLIVFWLIKIWFVPAFLEDAASLLGIAVAHSIFNILCTLLMLPLSGMLEKLVIRLVPDDETQETWTELDERLLAAPPIALKRCREVAADMAQLSVSTLKESLAVLHSYSSQQAASIREKEDRIDHYEDILATYLVKLSAKPISENDSAEVVKLLKIIGDFERIADHAVNLLEFTEEMSDKGLTVTSSALAELEIISSAIDEILDLSLKAFLTNDLAIAAMVEPLEQVIDQLKEQMRTRHILRMQQNICSVDAGFIWSDLLTNLERTSDHCSNIAVCIMDMAHNQMNLHQSLRSFRNDSEEFKQHFQLYASKYSLARL